MKVFRKINNEIENAVKFGIGSPLPDREDLYLMSKTYKAALLEAMKDAMDNNPNALIIGQGVTDFKGIFDTIIKVLLINIPDRVIETPLSEDQLQEFVLERH